MRPLFSIPQHSPNQGGQYASHKVLPLERQRSTGNAGQSARMACSRRRADGPRRPDGDQRAADFTDRHRRECSPRRRERRRGCGHRVGGRGNSVARAGKAMSIFNRKSFSASNASNAPRAYGGMTMRKVSTCVATQLAALALLLASGSASAWQCDFLTGGGFIIRTPPSSSEASGAHGNFGVGGACKDGGDGHGLWGHLEYIDHGAGMSTLTLLPLNAHWITITDYREWSSERSEGAGSGCSCLRRGRCTPD